MKARLVLAFVVMMAALWGRTALAAPAADAAAASPVTPGATAKAEARERFDRGLRLFEQGDNSAALAEFKRAYELIPNPVVLYNMGLVYAAMNHPVEATDALDGFLTQAGEKSSPEQHRKAQKVRDEQAARISRVLVVTDRPATVEIDGVEAGRTPMTEPLRLASGAHKVTALAPGYQPSRRELTLAGQVTETVTMRLLPTESGAAHLIVSSPVPGAAVWINDKLVGTTPLPASVAVVPGDVRIALRRAGYVTSERTLHLDEGANAKVDMVLGEDVATVTRRRLRLAVAAPSALEVTVDGAIRPYSESGILLPPGPHLVRVEQVGFERYERIIEVDPARDTTVITIVMTPTVEAETRRKEAAHTRGVIGLSLVGAGVAMTAGTLLYAVATRKDVDNAQAALRQQVAIESMDTVDNHCYIGTDPAHPSGTYQAFGCAATKAGLQSDVDSAKLKRLLAYSGAGLGVVAVAVGGYLFATRGGGRAESAPGTSLSLWVEPGTAGVGLAGRF
jgi:hypothetical protein